MQDVVLEGKKKFHILLKHQMLSMQDFLVLILKIRKMHIVGYLIQKEVRKVRKGGLNFARNIIMEEKGIQGLKIEEFNHNHTEYSEQVATHCWEDGAFSRERQKKFSRDSPEPEPIIPP